MLVSVYHVLDRYLVYSPQVAYTGLLQMFLTPRAVCLVVCDAGAFEQRDGEEHAQLKNDICTLDKLRVCDWLRSISQRVPRSDVILVATKCDLTDGNAAEVAGRMDAACRVWLASGVAADMEPVRLEDGVCLTSCSSKPTHTNMFQTMEAAAGKFVSGLVFGKNEAPPRNQTRAPGWEGDWRDDMAEESPSSLLHRIVYKRDGSGLRGAEMVLPNSWDIALTVLEALERGR